MQREMAPVITTPWSVPLTSSPHSPTLPLASVPTGKPPQVKESHRSQYGKERLSLSFACTDTRLPNAEAWHPSRDAEMC